MKYLILFAVIQSALATDPTPVRCLKSVVYDKGTYGFKKMLLSLDDGSSKECMLADLVHTEEEKKVAKIHPETNINVSDKKLIKASVVKRYVCDDGSRLNDFYLVEGPKDELYGWYSQFTIACAVVKL